MTATAEPSIGSLRDAEEAIRETIESERPLSDMDLIRVAEILTVNAS